MSLRHLCWDLRAEAMLKIVVDVFNREAESTVSERKQGEPVTKSLTAYE